MATSKIARKDPLATCLVQCPDCHETRWVRPCAAKRADGWLKRCIACAAWKQWFKHGERDTRTYQTWAAMVQRCNNSPDYVGRGIKVCDRWREYLNFKADMGERPPGKTLDRIDNNGNYTPRNCRWATRKEQQNNTRANRRLTLGKETRTVGEWESITGLSRSTILGRLNNHGWSVKDALTVPYGGRR